MLMKNRRVSIFSAGVISGLLSSFFAISYASLIFTGELAKFVPSATAFFLQGALIMGLISALFSSYRGAISTVQDVPAAMFAILAATLVDRMAGNASPEAMFATLVAGLALSAFSIGLGFWVLGLAKLGGLVWYIPFPVTAAFLSGVGLYLILGAIQIATGISFSWSNISSLMAPHALLYWIPAAIIGLICFLLTRRYRHPGVLPAFLVIVIIGFQFWARIVELPDGGSTFTLSHIPSGALWQLPNVHLLAMVDWPLLMDHVGAIGSILVVCHLSMLLNVSGLDIQSVEGIDVNRELKVAGTANLLLSLLGSSSGYNSFSLSSLIRRMQAKSRLTGIVLAVICALILSFGGVLLQWVPLIAISSILFFMGLNLLSKWLFAPWRRLTATEFAIVLLIIAAMKVFGTLTAVGIGLMLSIAHFVFTYSRFNIVRTAASGRDRRSNVERSQADEQQLRQQDDQIYILELEGFIFFGAGNHLTMKVHERFQERSRPALRYLLLDLRLVSGIDASAAQTLAQMQARSVSSGYTVIYTHVSPSVAGRLSATFGLTPGLQTTLFFEDTDRGLEWCEDQILRDNGHDQTLARSAELFEILRSYADVREDDQQRLDALIEVRQIDAGNIIIEHGKRPEGIYFVVSGYVSVVLSNNNGRTQRLRRGGPGSIYGEMSYFTHTTASVSLIADVPTKLNLLTNEALERIERDAPLLAIALHKHVAKVLSQRLATATAQLQDLQA
jgi:SulP family sulfate permease